MSLSEYQLASALILEEYDRKLDEALEAHSKAMTDLNNEYVFNNLPFDGDFFSKRADIDGVYITRIHTLRRQEILQREALRRKHFGF